MFQHHSFDQPSRTKFELIDSSRAAAVGLPEQADIGDVPQRLRRAGVSQVVLVHGTFAGTDAAGVAREIR